MVSIENPSSGMGYFQEIEQRGLLDFIHSILVGVVAGEGPLSHGIKEVGIEGCRVVDDLGFAYELQFPVFVVRKIGLDSQGHHILAASQPASKGYLRASQEHLYQRTGPRSGIVRRDFETFAQPVLSCPNELFDPLQSWLTKSQKLGLMAPRVRDLPMPAGTFTMPR